MRKPALACRAVAVFFSAAVNLRSARRLATSCCAGQMLYYCQNNQVMSIDCNQNLSCGWHATSAQYDCGTGGASDPSGLHPKVCN